MLGGLYDKHPSGRSGSANHGNSVMSDSSKERQVMMVMRKVLASIIKDTTPASGMKHPLSDATIQDVRMCLGLISARERELGEEAGVAPERPYFTEEEPSAKVVPMSGLGKQRSKTKEKGD